MRPHLTLLALALTSCRASAPAQAPIDLWVAHPKAEVVTLAAAAATSAGFVVTKSDTAAGALAAMREAEGDGNGDYLRCEQGQGQGGAPVGFSSKVTVSVVARDAAGGARVGISAEVRFARTGVIGPGRRVMEWTCGSSGEIERVILAALR
jgi:hypothetical protein